MTTSGHVVVDGDTLLLNHHQTPTERAAVLAWLRQHGIDGMRVIVPGWVAVNPDARQVQWLDMTPENRRGPLCTRDPDGSCVACHLYHEREPHPVLTVGVVQLESPPLPFPVMFPRERP